MSTEGSWSSLEISSGYWGPLFPAQGKQSDVLQNPTTAVVCIRAAVHVPQSQSSRCHVPGRFLELEMA